MLELGERIGYVNTGLKEDEMGQNIRKVKLSSSKDASKHKLDKKCSVCQVSLYNLPSLVLYAFQEFKYIFFTTKVIIRFKSRILCKLSKPSQLS